MPTSPSPIQMLLKQGVTILAPETVHIDPSIDTRRIAPDVLIHPGCRISGSQTAIGPGCELGREAPLTLINSQLGANVAAAGGFVEDSTLLDGVTLGACAHVRPGCLLEEAVSCGHAVGLKQSLLLPFVTLGSTINFCDVLMAGGTSASNHSEVGSSYIHFNFTAHQDKATPSLIGDIPRGVMLDQAPIFLGGQGGLVGPSRIAYGTIIAAGCVYRGDALEPGKLCFAPPSPFPLERDYTAGAYGKISRICRNNLLYIGNLHAMHAWYTHARPRLMADTPHARACLDGAQTQLARMVKERIKRLNQLFEKVRASHDNHPSNDPAVEREQQRFIDSWGEWEPQLQLSATTEASVERDIFLAGLPAQPNSLYAATVQALPETTRHQGTAWLHRIVEHIDTLSRSTTHE